MPASSRSGPISRSGARHRAFLDRLRQVALATKRPIMFGVLATKQGEDPTPWGYQTKYIDDTVAAGGRMFGQGTTRSINAIFSLKSYLPFDVLPALEADPRAADGRAEAGGCAIPRCGARWSRPKRR